MAPLPKPRDQRVRRNAEQASWRDLPASGRSGRAPALPDRDAGWLSSTEQWWATIWASPMATVWLDADQDGLVRLATLRDEFAQGMLPTSALPAMQALEDRFGLSPKARRSLQWEISRAAADGEKRVSATVRSLKAV